MSYASFTATHCQDKFAADKVSVLNHKYRVKNILFFLEQFEKM